MDPELASPWTVGTHESQLRALQAQPFQRKIPFLSVIDLSKLVASHLGELSQTL